jgi:hypothetical protein
MTTETLFRNDDQPIRFKIIRPVYEVLTVNDAAAQYFEPLEAISSSSHVVRLFDFLGRLFSLSIINRVSSSVIPEGVSPFGRHENTQCLTGQTE